MTLRRSARLSTAAIGLSGALLLAGCESDAQTGGLIGAGVGALAGQAIGGDTEGTLIGTGVGAAVGYAVGNESDKAKAREAQRIRDAESRYDPRAARSREPRPLAPTVSGSDNPLAGTRWSVVSLVWPGAPGDYADLTVHFGEDGALRAALAHADGAIARSNDRYRVVGDALIVERGGRIINAQFSLEGDELIVAAREGRAVLRRYR